MRFSLRSRRERQNVLTYLALFLLNECEYLFGEMVIFGARICEDVDERVGQRLLQRHLDGADAHLGAVAAALYVQVAQVTLELVRVGSDARGAHLCNEKSHQGLRGVSAQESDSSDTCCFCWTKPTPTRET